MANRKRRVLLAEGGPDTRAPLASVLTCGDFGLCRARTLEEATELLWSERFDGLVIDGELPRDDALQLLRVVRRELLSNAPVLVVLPAKCGAAEMEAVLEEGADSILQRPFEGRVLLALMRAALRRISATSQAGAGHRLQAGHLMVDLSTHKVTAANSSVRVTASEFGILAALLRNLGQVMSREQLIDIVRGTDVAIVERTIDTHVSSLRKKLGTCGQLIETVRSAGYRIRPD